jgi:hypothetical protein
MTERPSTRSAIRPVKERVEDELLQRQGVVGVDINEKVVGGRPTGELSVVVYVEEKKPKADLAEDELIPEEIDGIPTDVKEEKIELQGAFQAVTDILPQIDATRYRPLRGGISMGPCRAIYLEPPAVPAPGNYVTTGTLGAIVRDRTSGARMAMTNFHVACVDDTWSVGDTMAQPSRVDSGSCPADQFGSLQRAVLSENVDGAVVTLDAGEASECSIEAIGDVRGTVAATVGLAVRKRGRTTELTQGTVDSVDATVSIDYGDGLGIQTLRRQVRIVPDTAQNPRFSDRGDSGSVIVSQANRVVGLLFAGSTNGSATYANPIQAALDELGVDLCVSPTIITMPIICEPLVSRPIVCTVSRPIICDIVTKKAICQAVTSPKVCTIIRTLSNCPPRTLACPVTLACDLGRRSPPIDRGPADSRLAEVYGRPDADAVEDAYWLGYYTAIEAMSEAEAEPTDEE